MSIEDEEPSATNDAFDAYEVLRADYLKAFDEEAPHVQPLEMDIMSGYIKEAIETGIPLEHPEGDYVT